MKNIQGIKDCFGCGVCAMACNRKLINIRQNPDGFYEPYITDLSECTDCGLCSTVCSFNASDIALTKSSLKSYAAWSREHAVRRKCSSGGVSFEVGRYLLAKGYKI